MNKTDRGWFALILVTHFFLGDVVYYTTHSWWFYFSWLFLGLLVGIVASRFFRRRERRRLADEWRVAHPHVSDYWLPKELREE